MTTLIDGRTPDRHAACNRWQEIIAAEWDILRKSGPTGSPLDLLKPIETAGGGDLREARRADVSVRT
jgi:hypothetical protein